VSEATLAWQARRIEELEEQVLQLQERLGGTDMPDRHRVMLLRDAFRVSPSCAQMILFLSSRHIPASSARIREQLDFASVDVVRVFVATVRRTLGDAFIDTRRTGYGLSAAARAQVNEVLGTGRAL
jgi:hypothetical protein